MMTDDEMHRAATVLHQHALAAEARVKVERGAAKVTFAALSENYQGAINVLNYLMGDDDNHIARVIIEGLRSGERPTVTAVGEGNTPQQWGFSVNDPIPFDVVRVDEPIFLEGK